MDSTSEKAITMHELVSYYRELRPEKFSDSKVTYEIPLTHELFDGQLNLLSTKKMQSEFENFVVACASRLITPNIKPQTGPDGGGDGKVDAETYIVSPDISDKWYVAEGGALGNEKWAFAISCKKQWKPKVTSDVEKAVETGRGYTRILFFSNQFIKSSTRAEVEEQLSEKFNTKVSIFDGLWCSNAVFFHGCKDLALICLNFSEEYKHKNEILGPNDQKRQSRLIEIEKSILRSIEGLDTDYIDELNEVCILSRGLECPRTETEGRFNRALRECECHGSTQQAFNIIYDHAWTSFFWFEDLEAVVTDFKRLKEYLRDSPSVVRLEKATNILTNMMNAARADLLDEETVRKEVLFLKSFAEELKQANNKPSSLLYLQLYLAEQRLISHLISNEPIDDDIDFIRPLLLNAPYHLEISFEAQCQVLTNLNKIINDSERYECLIDDLTIILRKTRSEQEAAIVELDRAMSLMDKKKYQQAIRHFGFCIRPFEKEEYMEELIKSSGMMGIALYECGLPYSAEAYLVKSASLLLKTFHISGSVPYLLVTVLQKLCEVELMLGRIVMFLNWYELMMVVGQNGAYLEEKQFKENNILHDCAWACRFAASNLDDETISKLPAILEKMCIYSSSEYLKFALGYADEIEDAICNTFRENGWQEKMTAQPIFKQFLCDLNISHGSKAELQTTVRNCTLHIQYNNNSKNQIIAEIFLATLEALLATIDAFEIVVITPHINITIEDTEATTELKQTEVSSEYVLKMARNYSDKDLQESQVLFISYFFCKNSMTKESLNTLLESKQEGEKLMDRVSNLIYVKQSVSNVLGETFKCKLEDWLKEEDKLYPMKNSSYTYAPKAYKNEKQLDTNFYSINQDVNVWDGAGWNGCAFVFDQFGHTPPIFGLAFENLERGIRIVEEWKELLQANKPAVKIFIVRGVNKSNPSWYRVCVAPNIEKSDIAEGRLVTTMCRKHTMTPNNTINLDNFEKLFMRFGGCWFAAFKLNIDKKIEMPSNFDSAFRFNSIEFRNAWEISNHDIAKIALEGDDDPYIPKDKKNSAPIVEVMKELRSLKTQHH